MERGGEAAEGSREEAFEMAEWGKRREEGEYGSGAVVERESKSFELWRSNTQSFQAYKATAHNTNYSLSLFPTSTHNFLERERERCNFTTTTKAVAAEMKDGGWGAFSRRKVWLIDPR